MNARHDARAIDELKSDVSTLKSAYGELKTNHDAFVDRTEQTFQVQQEKEEPNEEEEAAREFFENETRANFEVTAKNQDWNARRFTTMQNELDAAYETLRQHNELLKLLTDAINNNTKLEIKS